eukprot:GEMP01039826.1.p1 GENE.GEMP01039826.1~~GEMP01039826.1.p1  ORF type:complete len:380 (+),score=58.52 GEMP01039826.1:28-1140(+)
MACVLNTPKAVATLGYEEQLALKQEFCQSHFQSLVPSELLNPLDIRRSPAKHFRYRSVFSVRKKDDYSRHFGFRWGDDAFEVMSDPEAPALWTLAPQIVDSLPILCEHLWPLREGLRSVKFHATVSGALLVALIYGPEVDWDGLEEPFARAQIRIAPIELMASAKGVTRGKNWVDEVLPVSGGLKYRQYVGNFTNPNPFMAVHTVEWLAEVLAQQRNEDLLELYCGAGNHTVALAPMFRRILAVDINRHLVDACIANTKCNNRTNVTVLRAPSAHFCRKLLGKTSYQVDEVNFEFTSALVDPPREGLDELTRRALIRYDNIVYISCNPQALLRDLEHLVQEGGHHVASFVLLDHFPYTSHLECGVYLQRI